MADELNVPTHRWYEPRNNIALPPNAVSAKYILANGVALIDAWINSRPWGPYSVDGFVPPLAFDFVADYYQTDSTATTFDSALTFARASSATMVDSTGAVVTVASGVPRRGHHVYNGSEWVNEGLLVESEARTNLLLNSGTLSTQNVTVTAVPHTLHFTGTGTVTLSGAATGSLVGVGSGEQNRQYLTFTPTAGTLTLTVSGTVTNAQIEAGSTPSSYIPTAGATVTRAAETLVIPSANLPWPAPQYVTGTELVTNGTFDTDISGWTTIIGSSAWASGQISVIRSSGSEGRVAAPISCEVGKVYRLTLDRYKGTTASTTVNISISSVSTAGAIVDNNVITDGTSEIFFVATQTNHWVMLRTGSGVDGNAATFDNISVKEINPLSVSIAMDGRMTYADTGTTATVLPVRWDAGGSVYIQSRVDTASTDVGRVVFAQQTGGVYDSRSVEVLTPGINVPFNIASRHGSTFINGAVDGVALTADLTPVALPDLSAANLQLGYTFMGTIGSFRIWADDIGDAGLVAATNPSTEPSLLLTFDSAETSFVDLGWSE